jgi:hypothetical protein
MTRAWSHKDPIVTVNGRVLSVDVAAWAESPLHDFANFITGPVDFGVSIPPGCTGGSVIAPGDTGWGTGYNIHFTYDTSLHAGTDSHGAFAEVAVVCTVPANVDTDGHEWRMRLTITPNDVSRSGDVQLFRSNSPSNPARCRV